jgi:hypothetical protein
VYDGLPGSGITMHLVIFHMSGKALCRKSELNSWARLFGSACWNWVMSWYVILSYPGLVVYFRLHITLVTSSS